MVAGTSEDQAKTDLCHAMADGKINVRVRIAAKDIMRGQVFTGLNIEVPPHLIPADFDWTHSQPVSPWRIGPALGQHYSWIEDWKHRTIDLIELSTDDVAKVLCTSNNATPRRSRPNSKSGAGAKSIAIGKAIDQVWPKGIPKGLTAKDRNNAIISKLQENQSSLPANPARAIQRVLAKRLHKKRSS
jgi:hypothetical protein